MNIDRKKIDEYSDYAEFLENPINEEETKIDDDYVKLDNINDLPSDSDQSEQSLINRFHSLSAANQNRVFDLTINDPNRHKISRLYMQTIQSGLSTTGISHFLGFTPIGHRLWSWGIRDDLQRITDQLFDEPMTLLSINGKSPINRTQAYKNWKALISQEGQDLEKIKQAYLNFDDLWTRQFRPSCSLIKHKNSQK